MALLFGDSFAHYLGVDILKKWTSLAASTGVDISPEYGLRPGASALRLTTGAGNIGYCEKTLPSTPATFIAGCWWKTATLATASPIMVFIDASAEHVSVRHTATGLITFTRNGTVLATSTNAVLADTWYHIEVKCLIDDTGGTYEVRVNGTAVGWIPAATGADTRNAGLASISGVRLWGPAANGGSARSFADFYLLDTTGTVAINFLGPCRFHVARPVAPGSSAQWTGNYADNFVNVSDFVGDGDTTFNQSSTAAQKDLFDVASAPAGTIHSVQHVLMARQDGGAARVIRPVTRIATTNYNGTLVNTGASYVFVTEPRSVSPATSAAWTDTEINAAEFGYELVS